MRMISKDDITFTIKLHPEYESVEQAGFDKENQEYVLESLKSGNDWAWAIVEVIGTYKSLVASEYLGCCSYENEDDFKRGGYYGDMCASINQSLNDKVAEIIKGLT